jgi:hypothetical protein
MKFPEMATEAQATRQIRCSRLSQEKPLKIENEVSCEVSEVNSSLF